MNLKGRFIKDNERVAFIKHDEDYGELSFISTLKELEAALRADDYTITRSKVTNTLYAFNDRNGIGHSLTIEYYTIN